MKFAVQSNLALYYLKLGDHDQCKKSCNSKNEKCLFRRSQAQLTLLSFDQAIRDFQTFLKINPSNLAAQQQIKSISILE